MYNPRQGRGSSNPRPVSYYCIVNNLAEIKITATLQHRDEYLGAKQSQVDGSSFCQTEIFGTHAQFGDHRTVESFKISA
jgi:hypothetical protein